MGIRSMWAWRGWTAAMVVVLSIGCSESPEHRLQRAQIALANNKPEAALDLTQSLLDARPDDVAALLIRAKAQMQLLQLDPAKLTLDHLVQAQPESGEVRRLMVNWTFLRLENLLVQSPFATRADMQARFDETMEIGLAQADWIRAHEKADVEALALRGRYAMATVARLRAMQAYHKSQIRTVRLPGDPPDPAAERVAAFTQQIRAAGVDAQRLFRQVVDADPRFSNIAEVYAGMLADESNWAEIWILAQRLAREQNLPPGASARLVLALLQMPDAQQPRPRRMETAWKLQEAVDPARRESPQWKVAAARLHLSADDVDKAQKLLEQIIAASPRHSEARFLLAHSYYLQGRYPQAKQLLDALALELKNSSEVHTIHGLTLYRTGDNALAKEALRKAIDLNPDNRMARLSLVGLMIEEGQIDKTKPDMDYLYANFPADAEVIRLKMRYEQAMSRPQSLVELLNRTERLSPLTDEHLSVLIDGYAQLRTWDKAQRFARELAGRHPDRLEAQLRLAEMLVLEGKDSDAKAMLADLRGKFPNATGIDQMLASLHMRRQQFDKAIDQLKPLVASQPDNVAARMLLARSYAGVALYEEALRQVDQVLEKRPGDLDARAQAIWLNHIMGRSEEVQRHVAQVSADQLSERANPALLAQIRLQQGDLDEAAAICNRAVGSGSTDPNLRLLLANIYTRKNEAALVEPHLQELIRLEPDSVQAFNLLASYYQQNNLVERGLSELKRLQHVNEPLALIAQAGLLANAGRNDQALALLQPLLDGMVRGRHRMALAIADVVARIQVRRNDTAAAYRTFDPLIQAGLDAPLATLRQIDMAWSRPDADSTARRLDTLYAQLPADQSDLRYQVIRRFVTLRRPQRAMELLDQWIAQQPAQPQLLRMKGDLLLEAGQPQEAAAAYRRLVEVDPDAVQSRVLLAQAIAATHDHPAAIAVLEDMTRMHQGARILGLAEVGQVYLSLGLNRQAAQTFERIEKDSPAADPRTLYAMGRALVALQRHDAARERLLRIPAYSPQFVPGQVLLARLEHQAGQTTEARKRLDALVSNKATAANTTVELMGLDLRQAGTNQLVLWSDREIKVDSLPEEMRLPWLQLRVYAADQRKDWPGLVAALRDLLQRKPDSIEAAASLVASLVQSNQIDDARQAFVSHPALASHGLGPLLAAAVGHPSVPPADYPALPRYVVALAGGDIPAARAAIAKLPAYRAVFASDLQATLERPDAATPQMVQDARRLAAALVAHECGLPDLSLALAGAIVEARPGMLPAAAMMAQKLLDQRRPLEPAMTPVVNASPDSALTLLVKALSQADAKRHVEAITLLRGLVQREPGNMLVRGELVTTLRNAGQFDEAIAMLESVYQQKTSDQWLVANDLAYLLAEKQSARLPEALELAKKAVASSPPNAALLDTLGWIEHLSGQNEAALRHLQRAVVSLRDVPEAHYHLGVTYAAMGNALWARHHLAAAADGTDASVAAKAKQALAALPKD